ncbi:MAG: DNA polymerase IV [Propionibacteriaceae bacterium]
MSIIMHVDMDAFYAMVALRQHPELRGKPMMVGGATRGVVLSASYEARANGVRSGMPMTQARRLSPTAIVLPPDFEAYSDVSKGVFAIFDTVTARVEAASIDEAFLDITGALKQFGRPRQIAELLRAKVADEQRITCSVGIGPTKFIAKLASREAKPDGVKEVPPREVISFLHPLPVSRMWGVGEATAHRLNQLGLFTVADLAHTPLDTLQRAFGPHQGSHLADLAWGRDTRQVEVRAPERSVGSSETFARDTDDPAMIKRELLRMAAKTAGRLRAGRMMGRTVVITIRFADFTTITRSATLRSPTDVTGEIYAAAVALWTRLALQRARIRLVGVRFESRGDLGEAYRQPELTEPENGWREAEQAVDAAVRKFGPAAVQRAILTRKKRPETDPEEG